MQFFRTVVYEISATDAEQADEIWADDGPECATVGGVSVLDEGTMIPKEEENV